MLLGLGYRPGYCLPALDHIHERKALAIFKAIKERADHLCSTLPSQYEYLTAMRHKDSLMASQDMQLEGQTT
jgi:hypothetical protein